MAKTITLIGMLAGVALLAGCQQAGTPHVSEHSSEHPSEHSSQSSSQYSAPAQQTAKAQNATPIAPPPPVAPPALHPEVPPMPVGSDAWFAWVDRTAGVSDGHGHGPDFGSSEWCHAANWRVFRVHNTEGDDCSPAWMRKLDQALRQAGH